MLDKNEISEVLSNEGMLATNLDYFRARKQQQELALAIGDAINDEASAVLEAGTGIGKTYAYLVPILLSGKRAIVSTSTKSLQEQLCSKDIPELSKALGIQVDVRLLKGRANYICKHRLQQTRDGGLSGEIFPDDRFIERDLLAIENYVQTSKDGDKAGIKDVKSFSKVWPLVTSTSSNCVGRECDYFSDCFVYKARDRARRAQIMVANHALLLSDAAQRLDTDEAGALLPNREVVVFDEAHTLPEDLPRHFATQLSTHDMQLNVQEAQAWFRNYMSEQQEVIGTLDDIENEIALLHSKKETSQRQAMARDDFLAQQGFTSSLRNIKQRLTELAQELSDNWPQEEAEEGDELSLQGMTATLASAAERLEAWGQQDEDHVAWAEPLREGWRLWHAPVDTSLLFDKSFVGKASCLLLSATMAFGGKLDSFKESLGIADAKGLIVGSPFDYEKKSILLLPDDMPDPNKQSERFVSELADLAKRLIVCNDGKAFLLFSSWRNLHKVKSKLEKSLGKSYKLLVQGDSPADKLVQTFRTASQPSVLLGTRTFWQGVDVRGSALSLVIVDRIPFAPPDDPLLSAQMEMYGDDAFMQVQLPRAALILKQAAGRLIRSENDQGVLVICDPRMRKSSYGKTICRSLPPMLETNDIDKAADFLSSA